MNIVLQSILIAGVLLFLLFIILLVKRSRLQVKYSLMWILLALVYLVMGIFPGIVEGVAELLHIKEKVNALFLISVAFIFILCFVFNLLLSKQSNKIKLLIQEISILRSEISKTDVLDERLTMNDER